MQSDDLFVRKKKKDKERKRARERDGKVITVILLTNHDACIERGNELVQRANYSASCVSSHPYTFSRARATRIKLLNLIVIVKGYGTSTVTQHQVKYLEMYRRSILNLFTANKKP